jgi:gliding motility-associated-like protein
MKKLLFLFCLLLSIGGYSQKECNQTSTGIPVLVCSTTPNLINICEETKTITFEIENTTTFTLSSVNSILAMLNGLVYVPNSVSGIGITESNIIDLSNPVFSLDSITPGVRIFTLEIKTNCSIYTNPAGSLYKINLNLDYIGNSTQSNTSHTSKSISIAEPALSIINVSNQVYAGNVGDVFQRCVTVTNQGLGYLSNFNLIENHGSDIVITGVDLNNIMSQSGTSMELSFGATEISAIGDNDNLFENGESITFCETVRIDACEKVASEYQMSWGCEGANCQVGQGGGTESANVIFPGIIPNVKSYAISTTPNCIEDNSSHQLILRNDGLGGADSLMVNITSNYTSSHFFDTNTLVITHNGVAQPIVIDSLYRHHSSYGKTCGVGNNIVGYRLLLPFLPAGDSLVLDFDINYCESANCRRPYFDGWGYNYSYKSVCNDIYNVARLTGNSAKYVTWGLIRDKAPPVFADGQTQTVSYKISSFGIYRLANDSSGKWILSFSKNACFSLAGGVKMFNIDTTTQWNSSKITEYDSLVVAEFNGPVPPRLSGGIITFDLQANCSNCDVDTIDSSTIPECSVPGGSQASNIVKRVGTDISLKIDFIPDTNCNTKMDIVCNTFDTRVGCDAGCDSGLIVRSFEFVRTTIGNPDVDKDGLPDNGGKATDPGVRLDRAILGDTLRNTIVSVMNFPRGSKWNWAYSRTSISNQFDLIDYLFDTVEIYRNGTKYTCTNITPKITTNSATSGQYLYDLSADTLIKKGCLPFGFLFEHGDSIIFKAYYKVIKNKTGIDPVIGSVSIHVNDSVESTRQCHRFYCQSYPIGIEIIPFSFYANYANLKTSKSCDSILISRYQAFRVGGNSNFYYGWGYSDRFPNEYRHFGTIDTIEYEVPPGYELSMARYREVRRGEDLGGAYIWSNNTTNSNLAWIPITPSNPDSTHLIFNIKELYNNGLIDKAHGGHYGYLQISIKPTCNVLKDVITQGNFKCKWDAKFGDSIIRVEQNRGSEEPIANIRETYRYDAPKLKLQANNPNLFAIEDTIAWTIRVSNLSNTSVASNVWLADFYKNTGVNILRIHDLDNGNLLNEVNGIYQINQLDILTERVFMVVANFSNCIKDSLPLAMGWNCPGYPDSAGAYECNPDFVTLTVTPRLPAIQTNITLASDSIRLCDTATYIVYLKNVLQGTAYNLNLSGIIPLGVTYLNGSSQISYATTAGLTNVTPTINNGIINWNFSTEPFININGFHGIGDPGNNEIEIRFKVLTDCDFTSGSKFNFYTNVVANCGDTIEGDVTGSSPLVITDAVPPYNTYNAIDLYQITPCSGNAPVVVTIANKGPGSFWTTDSVTIELPQNITYQGNYTDVLNGPFDTTLTITYNAVGNQLLNWRLPQGLLVGDTSRFSFEVQGNADTLTCIDIPRFNVFTTATAVATCISDNSICNIKTVTGDSTKNTFVLKSFPLIKNLTVTSTLLPPLGEQLLIDLDIQNSGESIQNGYNSTFEIFQDVDNSGTFTLTDTMIGSFSTTDSIDGNNNLTHFTFPINVKSGQACGIFVRLDSLSSSCFCNSDYVFITPQINVGLRDTIICSDMLANIGVDSINGYLYSWSPSFNIDDSTKANPVFTRTNISTQIDTVIKFLEINRGGCLLYDTMQVVVYPTPNVNAGIDMEYCEADTVKLNGNIPTSFEFNYWETLSNTSGAPINYIDSLLDSTKITNIGYGNFELIYNKGNQYCAVIKDTISIANYQQPSVSLTDIYLCNTNTTSLTAVVNPVISLTKWSSGVSGITYVDSSVINTTAQNLTLGESKIYLEAINGVCLATIDSLIIMNVKPHNAILPADTMLCEATSLLVIANGLDSLNLERGVWHIDSNYNTSISLSVVDDSSVTVNGLTYGEQRIVREIESNYCPSHYDTMAIIVYEQPTALAFPLLLCDKNIGTLNGLKTPVQATSEWKKSAGSTVVFTDSSVIPTNISFINYGASEIYLEITNGVCPIVIDTVDVQNLIPLDAILPNDTLICELDSFVLMGNSPDTSNLERGVWHIDSSYNPNLILTYLNDSTVIVKGLEYGEQRIVWEIQNDYCFPYFDTISVTMYEQPVATVMNDTSLCDNFVLPLSASFYPAGATGYYWSLDPSYPQASSATFSPTNTPISQLQSMTIGSYRLLWTVENGVCPISIDSVEIINNPNPTANFIANTVNICENECVDFVDLSTVNTPDLITNWNWFSNDSNVSKIQNHQVCFDNADTNTITLIVTTDNSCSDTLSLANYIVVNPNPIANFNYTPIECLQVDDIIYVKDLSSGAIAHSYTFGDGFVSSIPNPSHYYSSVGDYEIEQAIINNYGCVDTVRFSLFINEQTTVYIPNAFTPDGNGVNDVFAPVSSGITEYTMEVYNRWGEMIFRSDIKNKPWDGKFKDKLSKQDVYIWSITYKENCGTQKNIKGHVTLVR